MGVVQKQKYSKRLMVTGRAVSHSCTSYLDSFPKGSCHDQFLVYPASHVLHMCKNLHICFLFFKEVNVGIRTNSHIL